MSIVVSQETIEQLAAVEHERWASWQAYFHSKCVRNDDGSLTVPSGYVAALERQIALPYAELTEQEKEYDRDEVMKSLAVLGVKAA